MRLEGTRIDVNSSEEIDVEPCRFAAGAPRRAGLKSDSAGRERRGSALAGWCLAGLLVSSSGLAETVPESAGDVSFAAADAVRAALTDETLRELIGEVLERNPEIARARHRAASAAARAPQVKALPDPEAKLAIFALPPETRVGPQRLNAAVTQRFPWFGKLALRERAALFAAAAARADVEALRLRLLTEARRMFYELSFLGEHVAIAAQEREHLTRHEEIARARYSAGLGLLQEVIKIQADITRSESRLLEIEMRRRSVLASLNALRHRSAATELEDVAPVARSGNVALPRPRARIPALEQLRERSWRQRPELAAARAEIAQREALVELAGKGFRPDFRVGISYTVVDRRQDEVGRIDPPAGDGDDILELSAVANLPIWKRKLNAALEEALREQSSAEERRRQVLAEIEGEIGDAVARLPLLYRQSQLFENVLLTQAEETARSSEAGYVTGKLNALDLLHAHHVLFEVRIALLRTQADYAIAFAHLEAAIGGPVATLETGEGGVS